MVCPNCQRPLWAAFVKNVYHPRAGEQKCSCRTCKQATRLTLPTYLSETPYVLFGAMLITCSLLLVLAIDLPSAPRNELFASVLVLWAGLITLLTWTRTRVR